MVANARLSPGGATFHSTLPNGSRLPGFSGASPRRQASARPVEARSIVTTPSDHKPNDCDRNTPSGAPMPTPPYAATPFQEIIRAVLSAPSRLMPQLIAEMPIRLCAKPRINRLPIITAMLAIGQASDSADASSSSPLINPDVMPIKTVFLAPRSSASRPAKGRHNNVVRYCAPITMPATAVLNPKFSWI